MGASFPEIHAIQSSAPDWRGRIVYLWLALALMLGGGGSSAPVSELGLQICATACALAFLLLPSRREVAVGWPVGLLAALILALPLLQLVPLPPSVWQALPGREVERAALALAGAERAWMPWSVAPARTLASLLAMIPPVALMVAVAALERRQVAGLLGTVALVALLSVVVGAFQLSGGPDSPWRFYGSANFGFLNGFQAYRNAQADVLLIGLVAGAASLRLARHRFERPLAFTLLAALGCLLALACILTGSRTGIALLPLAVAAVAWLWRPDRLTRRHGWQVGGALAALGVLIAVLVRENALVGRIAGRFLLARDPRLEIWEDTRFAIAGHWPFGSGIGTFRPVFEAAERLEVVDPTRPVRAYSEYLELLLEGGAVGAALLVACVVVVVGLIVRGWRRRDAGSRELVITGGFALAIVALHGGLDYPLRSMALAHLAALATGLLAVAARPDRYGQGKAEQGHSGA